MAALDFNLVERARSGDREAFDRIVDFYSRRVYATARRLVGSHADADDVAQEAFLRAYRGIRNFDGRADFFTWLYRIVVNVGLNHLRANRDRAPERDPGLVSPVERLEARERTAQVEAALGKLPEAIRAALVLTVIEGISHAQAAEILECAEGTVDWRVNQARKMLRDSLSDKTANEDPDGRTRSEGEAVRIP